MSPNTTVVGSGVICVPGRMCNTQVTLKELFPCIQWWSYWTFSITVSVLNSLISNMVKNQNCLLFTAELTSACEAVAVNAHFLWMDVVLHFENKLQLKQILSPSRVSQLGEENPGILITNKFHLISWGRFVYTAKLVQLLSNLLWILWNIPIVSNKTCYFLGTMSVPKKCWKC